MSNVMKNIASLIFHNVREYAKRAQQYITLDIRFRKKKLL
jgi:hypothetical protein